MRFNVAVLINISPDHLERHGDMAGYVAAKRRIFAGQGEGHTAVIGIFSLFLLWGGAGAAVTAHYLRATTRPVLAWPAYSAAAGANAPLLAT